MKTGITLLAGLLLTVIGVQVSVADVWIPDQSTYSIDLDFSDSVAELAGHQGTAMEAEITAAFIDNILADGNINSEEYDLIRELLALGAQDDLLYRYQSKPYADLVRPNAESRELLSALLQ